MTKLAALDHRGTDFLTEAEFEQFLNAAKQGAMVRGTSRYVFLCSAMASGCQNCAHSNAPLYLLLTLRSLSIASRMAWPPSNH
ncbi:MAG: hypothetical protein PHI97_30355 [Desulfobulbus sp.]|nr:hypothetical protein [Desulfobulbus sp.]